MVNSSPTPIHRVFAFVSNIWVFILTLVRSLLTLFSFRRQHSRDPLTLPRVNRPRKDAFARAHRHLRPILLTPRTLALSTPNADGQLGRGTRNPSALTLFPGCNDNPSVSASTSVAVPHSSIPQRTSPKLDPNDAELGLSAVLSSVSSGPNSHDHSDSGPSGTSGGVLALSGVAASDDTSPTTLSSSSLPLTPPEPCYLGPVPSMTDCPYTEPWPTTTAFDRSKQKSPGRSPLKTSFGNEPGLAQTWIPDSPSVVFGDGRWSPVPIWTSTPRKHEEYIPPAPLFGDNPKLLPGHTPYATTAIGTQLAIGAPFVDDASLQSTASFNMINRDHMPRHVPIPRPKANVSHLDLYTWRRHGARLPGKADRGAAHSHSQSHIELRMDRPIVEWYDGGAYLTSPVAALSPPTLGEDEDEDEVPLGRLLKLRTRQRVGMGVNRAAAFDAKRAVSEGCLFMAMDTPTKVGGLKAREGNGAIGKEPLEVPPLQFTETTTAKVSVPATAADVFSVDVASNGDGGVLAGVIDAQVV